LRERRGSCSHRIIWERHEDDEYIIPVMERALAALGKEDSPLRVRLLARLAGGPLRSARFPRHVGQRGVGRASGVPTEMRGSVLAITPALVSR
jgi:hypothetical protein